MPAGFGGGDDLGGLARARETVTVSKKVSVTSSRPATLSVAASVRAWLWTRSAIAFSPSGPW